jgi:cell division transport system permease protein
VFDRIQFLISEGFLALRRNGWMTFAAITTVAVALFFIGGLSYSYSLLKSLSASMTGVIDIRASVVDGTPKSELTRIAKEIRALPGVKTAVLIPKEGAWKLFLDDHPEHREYEEVDNPYPDRFKVTVTDLKLAESVANELRAQKGILTKEVKYANEAANFLAQSQSVVAWLGIAVGGLMFITAGVLIYNSIRLTVISRRLEIRIMQLVGASFLTVRIPFYIEGIIQGAVGGLMAVFLVFAGQNALMWRIREIAADVKEPHFPWIPFLVLLPALGAVYGLLCSMIAVRTPLRYR